MFLSLVHSTTPLPSGDSETTYPQPNESYQSACPEIKGNVQSQTVMIRRTR